MIKSKIEWTETTWSPVIGCTKVSAGCKHCYAEREVETRWSKNPKSIWYGRNFADVLCRPEAIAGPGSPLRWRKPRRIFVCPRADLFHDDVPDLFIADVFGVMAATPQHTYQVLTKRPERMRRLLGGGNVLNFVTAVAECAAMYSEVDVEWPLENVHLGVSIEDQPSADQRIGELLQTPAAVHWVSAEPLLGHVFLGEWIGVHHHPDNDVSNPAVQELVKAARKMMGASIDWCVVGGESGPNGRPMHPGWARSLRDQCAAAGVPFLFKQWGEFHPSIWSEGGDVVIGPTEGYQTTMIGDCEMVLCGKKSAGRLLDGVLHDAYPEARS